MFEKNRLVWYSVFGVLLLMIYARGLRIPLMHNDSAHHANIALHMFTTGDYVSLIDRETGYLDKPHFLFWTAALSYEVFGVSAFAYKITSFLFGLVCLYATYSLAKVLYNEKIATFAIAILATTYSFLLAFNDVRMDAILTATITFSIWQLILLCKSQNFKHVLGAALGLSIGFSTKGALGIVIPIIAVAVFLAQENSLQKFFSAKWVIVGCATLTLMLPVLYCYYLQFDLHPEKVVREVSGNSGVGYILFGQSLQRLATTSSGVHGSRDPFFYLHTFLWTALPWTILGIAALVSVVKNLIRSSSTTNRSDVFLFLLVLVVVAILSVASSKLPHYLNIIFPFLSILIAAHIFRSDSRTLKNLRIGQHILIFILLLLSGVICFYFFPVKGVFMTLGFFVFLTLAILSFFIKLSQESEKIIFRTVTASMLLFFVLNFQFYPSVLEFQGGKILAEKITHAGIPPSRIAFLSNLETANDLDFQLEQNIPSVELADIYKTKPLYIITGDMGYQKLKEQEIPFEKLEEVPNYKVSKLSLKFLNPSTRESVLGKLYLLQLNQRDRVSKILDQ